MNTPEMTTAPVDLDAPTSSGSRCNPTTRNDEKGNVMMTHRTDATPDVPLPAGALPPEDVARGWADYDNEFRILYGPRHALRTEVEPESEVWVEACAVQMADGSIQPRGDRPQIESGPTVSVHAHSENYLTADEARALADFIKQSADDVERWANPERHVCDFEWCEVNWRDENEHWWLEYATASARDYDPKVGIGVSYNEGHLPEIVVHLDGGRHDADVDTHLRLSEALALRDLLDRAITTARAASLHMANQVIAQHG